MHVTGNRVLVHLLGNERADLELNYAARDFYYIPIQMTSANTGVKPRRRSDECAFIIASNLERR